MTINDQIRTRITAFAAELEALVRAAAVESVRNALGGSAHTTVHTPAVVHAPSNLTAKPAGRPASRKSGGGGKRDPKVLAATVERAAEWVKANPGKGVEAMSAALKVSTKDLALPVIKLLDSKRIKKTGVKRATKYFPK
jgi:hypothetical protein